MRELLALGVIDFIISTILILLKIFWNIVMELGNISSGNIFITPNHHNDIIYYYNDNYI